MDRERMQELLEETLCSYGKRYGDDTINESETAAIIGSFVLKVGKEGNN